MSSVANQADHDRRPICSRGADGGARTARAMKATSTAGPASVVAAVIALHVLALAMLARDMPLRNEAIDVRVVNAVLVSQPAVSDRAARPAPARRAPRDAMRAAPFPHEIGPPVRERVSHPAKFTPPITSPAAGEPFHREPSHSAMQTKQQSTRADTQADQPATATPQLASAAAPSMAAPPTPSTAPPVATPRRVAHLDCALVKPDYPSQSLRRGQAGTVVVELESDVAGRVSAARIVTSSGYEHLDEAARAAVLASHCRPYAEDGRPIPALADVPVTFNLDE